MDEKLDYNEYSKIYNMTYDDAVKYCEEHECEECEVYLKDLDKRSKHEKENLHYPCCVNLVDDDKK